MWECWERRKGGWGIGWEGGGGLGLSHTEHFTSCIQTTRDGVKLRSKYFKKILILFEIHLILSLVFLLGILNKKTLNLEYVYTQAILGNVSQNMYFFKQTILLCILIKSLNI